MINNNNNDDDQNRFINFIYFYFHFREKFGIINFKYIFDLTEGTRFIGQYFKKNKKFATAAKEMSISLLSKMRENEATPFCQAIVDQYANLI